MVCLYEKQYWEYLQKKCVYFGGSFKTTMHVVTMAVVTKHSQNPFCGLKKLALLVKLARST